MPEDPQVKRAPVFPAAGGRQVPGGASPGGCRAQRWVGTGAHTGPSSRELRGQGPQKPWARLPLLLVGGDSHPCPRSDPHACPLQGDFLSPLLPQSISSPGPPHPKVHLLLCNLPATSVGLHLSTPGPHCPNDAAASLRGGRTLLNSKTTKYNCVSGDGASQAFQPE